MSSHLIHRVAAAMILASPLFAQQTEKVDAAAIARIREEGLQRSKVMEITSYLTDVYGARLTGSPQTKAAADWVVSQLKSWGTSSPRLETWGPFGRGWSNEKFTARVVAPTQYPLIAYPGAWSVGTKGPVTGEVVVVRIDSASDIARYRGTLNGKWVMVGNPSPVTAHWTAQAQRFSDIQLDSLGALPLQAAQQGRGGGGNAGRFGALQELARQRNEMFVSEGVAGVLQQGRGDGGTVFAQGTGSRATNAPASVPTIIVSAEHYGRIARTLAKGVPVRVEIEADNRFYSADTNSFNIVAELPGTDRRLRDDVVMLGAHFDSWHTGTGATDNAAGSAVMLEALRILKAAGLPLRRTVRLALWTGEEQGLLGSRAYVRDHFGVRDSTGLHVKPDHEKFSSYFNVDNGTGAIRGVYLQGNEAVRPVFQAWMEPFKDLGMRTLSIRNTGGTDHLSFDGVGLPGFQFIQDEIEYGSRTHHSNQDVYERIQEDDMKRNAVIVAAFVYLAANRDEKLPRKPQAITP
ncbi:MAG TPA: M20/M25/M40 family metallo-hydrolase [Gemmatimonadaceae bacterium]|nr:M20/M25/M40 family metallo-hydrolase [Gemmatimonadaceae bacterium]